MTSPPPSAAHSGRDLRIISVIGVAHFLSHFYMLAIPPLFPAMREEMGVGYAALGAVVAILSAVTALGQTPVGVGVDRLGAAPWLVGGTLLMALGAVAMGFAPGWWGLVAAAILSGLGNATIHPADYAILAGSISQGRMGRAFSLHTAAGYAGFAAAPPIMIALQAWLGWRGALVTAGLAGLPVVLTVALSARVLRSEVARPTEEAAPGRVLTSRPILLLFAFMTLLAMGGSGAQTFMVTVLTQVQDIPVATAAAALTAWLVASTAGTLLGGQMADSTPRLSLIVAAMLLTTACLVAVMATLPMGGWTLIGVATVAGLTFGAVMPSRDLLVKQASPPGTTGRVFGFVSAGLPLGAAIVPTPLGWLIDHGRPSLALVVCAVLMAAAVFTAGSASAAKPVPAAAE